MAKPEFEVFRNEENSIKAKIKCSFGNCTKIISIRYKKYIPKEKKKKEVVTSINNEENEKAPAPAPSIEEINNSVEQKEEKVLKFSWDKYKFSKHLKTHAGHGITASNSAMSLSSQISEASTISSSSSLNSQGSTLSMASLHSSMSVTEVWYNKNL